MAYSERELSNFDGKPILLYEFSRAALAWRYCTADRDITYDEQLYSAVAISDAGVKQTGDTKVETFDVTLPATAAVPLLWRGVAPSEKIWLRVRRLHYGDLDTQAVFVGSIAQVSQTDEATSVLSCQSIVASLRSSGLRLGWQRGCPHMLYDNQCKVDKAAYAWNATITALDGVNVQAAEFAAKPNGWFTGGFLEWSLGSGAYERRMIQAHQGNLVGLLGSTYGLSVGMPVTAYPGCNLTGATCANKFNNIANYGGVLHLPGKSPFDGNLVF